MNKPAASPWGRLLERIEQSVVVILMILLIALIAVALYELVTLFVTRMGSRLAEIHTTSDFQEALQAGFGGVLIVLLGLELLETMKVYFQDHRFRIEVIILVAIIATGRHMILIDMHHTNPMTLFGLAALMLALSGSYYLLKRGSQATRT